MKWKLFLRSLSVSAPRVIVRSRAPWPLRAALGFVVLAVAAAAGVALYEYGRQFGGPDARALATEVDHLKLKLAEAEADRDRYAAVSAAYESQLKVERASQEQLAQRVAALGAEATQLREDLSFFESLLPAAGDKGEGVLIRSFRLQAEATTGDGEKMRYKLLVQQSGRPKKDFSGSVQLVVHYSHAGRDATLQLPQGTPDKAPSHLQLSFRHYQRVEGTLSLPAGAVARSVLVRIVSGRQVKAQQTFEI